MGQRHFTKGWPVIRIELAWKDQRDGANRSIELSRWCKEQGLIDREDYNWQFKPSEQVTVFYFEDSAESFATLFALKWNNNEI